MPKTKSKPKPSDIRLGQITIEWRSHDVMAYFDGNRARWGCGKTVDEAIGDLVRTNAKAMGLYVKVPPMPRWKRAEIDRKTEERLKRLKSA